MRYLTFKEVAAINQYIIAKFSSGEQIGIKAAELLDSAIHRPEQSAFGTDTYATLFEKAAALFESIAQNHAFHNANKRTAFISLTQFLYYNGYDFQMSSQEAQAVFTVDVVNKKISFEETAGVIEKNSKKLPPN